MIKVLHIITGLDTGGAEMMLFKLLSGMDRNVVESHVISLSPVGPVGEKIRKIGIPVISLGMNRGIPNPSVILRLARLSRSYKPHIIQGWMYHGNLAAQLAGIFAGRGVPVLWNVRQSLYSLDYEKRVTAVVIKMGSYISRLPECIIYNAKISAEQHKALGYSADNRVIISNGFNTDIFSPSVEARNSVRSELNLPSDAYMIGLIGRYHPMKDHHNFLKAASIMIKINPGIHFVLVGSQVDFANEHLQKIINDLNISANIHLLGERSDIPRLTAAMDIASSSSFAEAFANAIGEAMSCGVPCAVTDVGDSDWIVGDTGKVVPPRDPDALAKAWQELIEMGEKNRHMLGMKARQRVIDNFSIDFVVRQYEALYERIVSLRG